MDVFEAIKRRRSVRQYKNEFVEEEKLNRVLEAARLAPSAENRQPWRFIVVTDPKVKKRLRKSYDYEWFLSAPLIIIACALPREAWVRQDGEEYWKVDVAIAVQNLILAATEEGLGTCWIGDFNEKEAKKALGVPKDVRVVAMMPLGYPDEESAVSLRKPLCEIVCYNQWLASEGEFYVVKAHTRFLKRTAARGKTLLNRLK